MPFSIDESKITELNSILLRCHKAAIVVHTHPDGDALGSALAMQHYLREVRGIAADAIIPDTMPRTMDFLLRGETLVNAEEDGAKAAGILERCDLLIVMDMNGFHRADALEGALRACKAPDRVLIDHHIGPHTQEFTLVFSQTDISSASELCYWVLKALEGGAAALPEKSRIALMTGMTTDTNNFANSVYASTLAMAGELVDAGVDRDSILHHLYQEYSENRVRAFARLLARGGMKILPGGIACIVSTRAFQKRYPLRQGETEGLVNIPLEISDVNMSLFLKQEDDHFRVSIRSKKGWSANEMATEFFHGGGHELAAGGKLFYPRDISEPSQVYSYLQESAARFVQNKMKRT